MVIILISPQLVFSQSDTIVTAIDSTNSEVFDYTTARVEYFTGKTFYNFTPVDTTLNNFQKFNPMRSGTFLNAYLGNLGAPGYARWLSPERSLGFDYGRHERDAYMFDIDDVKYYRCNVPFTPRR